MLERDAITQRHNGCPNRYSCKKDESKCCFLITRENKCYLETNESEDYL